ncbi:hypothetical protein EXIGLDRAFT_729767 [Exidia glandulosa HHB12029]|uniref:Uncharacterized protein n=1 Tax=Exidia glandulosa HHB12029 TaxID=1314781 RepID=A0A165CGI0_EXIGL|nr:hypothetical protein EXIGLDRAFT_729767 [Exidia glandulosa HHB12029]
MSRESDLPRTDPVAQREVPNRYSRLLEAVSGGHTLFKPQSNVLPQRGGVIGDGGYIDKGRFIWLFNVFDSAPEGIPGLDWSEVDDIVSQAELNTTVLKSSTASSVRFHASAGTDTATLPLSLPPTSIEPKVSSKESAFAFLAFAGKERQVRILKRPGRTKLKEWLARHYDQLYNLYEGDVVLVCETVQSSGWLGGLAYHGLNSVSGDVEITAPGFAFGAGFTRERETELGLMCTCGPGSEAWTVDSPPIYTVIIGLVVARRQRVARIRRKLIALFASHGGQSESSPVSGVSQSPSSNMNAAHSNPGPSNSYTGLESAPPPCDHNITVDVESASDTSQRECGDDNVLDRILEEALARHSDAHIAVADWSLIGTYTNNFGELPDAPALRFSVEWRTLENEERVLHVLGIMPTREPHQLPEIFWSQPLLAPSTSFPESL